jgi:hypothetical protein
MLLDVIKDIAIICASIAAVYGVNSWRRESIGKRQIELCEEVLARISHGRRCIGPENLG